jgi:clathrin heavy chain
LLFSLIFYCIHTNLIIYQPRSRSRSAWRSTSRDPQDVRDAIDTAKCSEDAALVEELMRFFVEVKDKECFCAMLFTCNELVKPDVALELAWRNGYTDYMMPFVIHYVRNIDAKVKELDDRTAPKTNDSANGAAAAAGMITGREIGGYSETGR